MLLPKHKLSLILDFYPVLHILAAHFPARYFLHFQRSPLPLSCLYVRDERSVSGNI
jgi:hypothetical protein